MQCALNIPTLIGSHGRGVDPARAPAIGRLRPIKSDLNEEAEHVSAFIVL